MTINCKGKLLDLNVPRIMGILNLTPDSFYDGGMNSESGSVMKKVEKMVSEGMDILDIGGQTTRPGAETVSISEELQRVLPYLELIRKEFPDLIISVDTFYAEVARETVAAGAGLINDISAGSFDGNMFKTVAELGVPYILMHMKGKPKNMQEKPEYRNVVIEVNQFFSEKIAALKKLNVNDIILDAGYGFGKTTEHNFQLLKNQELIGYGDFPVLAGVSRKSMICKTLGVSPKDALNGTTAIHMLALQHGAKILRVHDVKEAAECIKLFQAYQSA